MKQNDALNQMSDPWAVAGCYFIQFEKMLLDAFPLIVIPNDRACFHRQPFKSLFNKPPRV